MSLSGRPTNTFIPPDEYQTNQAKIAAAQKYLEALKAQNEAGLRNFEELEAQKRELQKKIEEGEQAKHIMQHFQNMQSNMTRGLLEGPRQEFHQGTAKIEEVPLGDSVHGSPASQSQHAQRIASTPILSPPPITKHYPGDNPSQANLPHGSGFRVPDAQRGRIPLHTFAQQQQQQQAVYPPHAIVLPEAPPTVAFTEAAASASRNGQAVHYQPVYQTQGLQNTNSYYNGQIALPVQRMNVGSSNTRHLSQAGPSSANQSYRPYSNTGQNLNPTYLPPMPAKTLDFVLDKDNSPAVRFLNITLSDIPLLKSKISEFARVAPLGSKVVIHPEMAIWKDQNSVVWLYIRVEGGFWRYRHIDQFFEGQIRLAQSHMDQGAQRRNNASGMTPAHPTPAAVATERSSFSTTAKLPLNRVVTGTVSQHITANGSNSTSTSRQLTGKVTPAAAAAPSNLTGPTHPIDKKNLSKHILFALGKRLRDVSQRSPEAGPPTKKPSLGTFAVSQTPESTVLVSATNVATTSPAQSLDVSQPTKSSRDATTSQQPHTLPSTSASTHVSVPSQSMPTQTTVTRPQAASGSKDTPLITKSSATPVPTFPVNPPTQATTVPSSNATSLPSTSVPSTSVPDSRTLSHNANQPLITSQHAPAVAANAVSLPPIYQPHPAGSSQTNQSVRILPTTSTLPGLAAITQQPSQAILASTSRESQSVSVATNVGALRQEQHRPNQQLPLPSKEPISSAGPKQNVLQNAQAGPSNVGTSREPLFLPSPGPSSTSHSATPHTRSGPADSKTSRKGRKQVYVLVPPRPEYLVAHKRRLAEKRAAHLLGGEGAKEAALAWEKEPGDACDEPIIIGEDYSSGRNTPIDGFDRESLRLAATRIDVFPCRWDRCDVVLNCANSLLKHLTQHPPEPSLNNRSYTCRWTQCGRRCTYKEKHLENHAFLPLRCAFKNCTETFRSATQLTKHFRSKHKNHALKPAAELRQPELESLPDVPGVVPAYPFVTKLVKPATISKNRHSQLVPNVVTRIVDSDPERPATLRTRKAVRSTVGQAFSPADTARNEYDFMTARSIRYSSYLSQPVDLRLSDLDSTNISELLDEGLMLWTPDGDSANDDDGGDDMMFDRGDIKIEDGLQPGLGATAVSSISDRGHIEQRIDEEELVANMLT